MTMPDPKGWCPTVYEPMPTGDGLLVRVKPPNGVLSATSARTLTMAAARYGNGVIELTNRASLQVRGLTAAAVAPFAAAMVAARLADPDPIIERRRAVIASPLAGDDPGVSRHAASVTAAIEAMLTRQSNLAALPSKFGCLVDGGGVLPVGPAAADIRIVLDGDICLITADGARRGVVCHPSDAANIVLRLALAFLAYTQAITPPARRMRTLIAGIGASTLFTKAGITATRDLPHADPPNAIGGLAYEGTGRGAFGVGLPFGATHAATLEALADLSETFGDGTLRLTPWRALAIPGVTQPHRVHAATLALGLIADQDDPRLRVFACPGKPACAAATVETRTHAAGVATLGLTKTVHVSGCAKGCAHPLPADITLVGETGRYGIIRHGRASDAPLIHGVTITQVLAHLGEHRDRAVP